MSVGGKQFSIDSATYQLQTVMILLVISSFVNLTASQTYHYSRGWTNGRKRSDISLGLRSEATGSGSFVDYGGDRVMKRFLKHDRVRTSSGDLEVLFPDLQMFMNSRSASNGPTLPTSSNTSPVLNNQIRPQPKNMESYQAAVERFLAYMLPWKNQEYPAAES
ncbi:uncharacterized protein LOC143037256 [Oratosquilla oratoria]|uniref:uncharacterized protein LOC143037256 n=1 Tax=Oratosquilla oratoria TaxID=337810 RepID=UPI003F765834